MDQGASGRRGFLRQTALVMGAFLVGVGRTNIALASSHPACTRCRGTCTSEQKANRCGEKLY